MISGYVEKRDENYLNTLIRYADQCDVPLIYLGDDLHRKYELFDIYPYADIITYPSEYEGFGNQLLEAVFAKKQVVLFEYPVYKTDIKNRNFDFLSFGDDREFDSQSGLSRISKERMEEAVTNTIFRLKNGHTYSQGCDRNFILASQYFSYENTLEKFRDSFI